MDFVYEHIPVNFKLDQGRISLAFPFPKSISENRKIKKISLIFRIRHNLVIWYVIMKKAVHSSPHK